MDPRLATLIDLQKARGAQFELERQFQEIPKQCRAVQQELDTLNAEVEKAREAHIQTELQLRRKEKLLLEVQEEKAKKERRLLEIKNNKEYQAATSEIESLTKRIKRLEEEIVTAMEEVEAADKVVADKKEKIDQQRSQFEERINVLKSLEAGLQGKVDHARAEADRIAANVAPPLLKRFTRVFDAKNGVAMATANGDHCGACNVKLTPHTVQLAKRGQDFVICEGCGRFLYWDHDTDDTPVF